MIYAFGDDMPLLSQWIKKLSNHTSEPKRKTTLFGWFFILSWCAEKDAQ